MCSVSGVQSGKLNLEPSDRWSQTYACWHNNSLVSINNMNINNTSGGTNMWVINNNNVHQTSFYNCNNNLNFWVFLPNMRLHCGLNIRKRIKSVAPYPFYHPFEHSYLFPVENWFGWRSVVESFIAKLSECLILCEVKLVDRS